MKSVFKVLALMIITALPVAFANAACPQQKAFLLNEINSAITTYPNSCRSQTIHFQCDVLFRTKLPQLRSVITKNEFANLQRVVQGVNDNLELIRSIVADQYQAPMNSLINDLNVYQRNCGH